MALTVTSFKRKFIYTNSDNQEITLPDPDQNILPEKVPQFYSPQYPELTNATIEGPELKDEEAIYKITAEADTKG